MIYIHKTQCFLFKLKVEVIMGWFKIGAKNLGPKSAILGQNQVGPKNKLKGYFCLSQIPPKTKKFGLGPTEPDRRPKSSTQKSIGTK